MTSERLGDVVDEEMSATASAVESATQRIQDMLRKSREDDSGVKLEVNERILDSCTDLMKAIKILIARSKDLQAEILKEGMVNWDLGCVTLTPHIPPHTHTYAQHTLRVH